MEPRRDATRTRIAELERELRQMKLACLTRQGDGSAPGTAMTIVVVRTSARRLAIPIERVAQVIPMPLVEPLPGAPSAMRGTVDIHGRLVPVLDLSPGLGEAPRALGPEMFLVLLTAGERTFALAVQDVERVVDLGKAELGAAYVPGDAPLAGCVVPSGGESLIVLDVDVLLDGAELDALPGLPARLHGDGGS